MKELKQRLIISAISILLLIVCIPLSTKIYFRPVFLCLIAVVACLALGEYLKFVRHKGFKPPVKVAMIAGVLYIFSVFIKTIYSGYSILPQVIFAIALLLFFLFHFTKHNNAIAQIAMTSFGLVYVIFPLSCMVKITYSFQGMAQDGRWWLVYLLAVTKMTDIGGFVIGKTLGKFKLAEKVSPGKTVEGSIGGIVFSTLTSLLIWYLAQSMQTPPMMMSLVQAVGLGIVIGAFAQIGDLAESVLKRDAGVKNSSSYLPGMGGMLDLVDALLFTTPLLWAFLWINR